MAAERQESLQQLADAYGVYDLCRAMGWTYEDYVTQPAWWVARMRAMRQAEHQADAALAERAQRQNAGRRS